MDNSNDPTTSAAQGDADAISLDRRRPLMRVDLTINIPTILAIVGLVGGCFSAGIGIYRDLDNRQLDTARAVVEIRTRLDKTEAALSLIRTDQAAQTATLRTEMKGDIGEIKDMLNRLIFGGSPVQPRRQQLNDEWSKK